MLEVILAIEHDIVLLDWADVLQNTGVYAVRFWLPECHHVMDSTKLSKYFALVTHLSSGTSTALGGRRNLQHARNRKNHILSVRERSRVIVNGTCTQATQTGCLATLDNDGTVLDDLRWSDRFYTYLLFV